MPEPVSVDLPESLLRHTGWVRKLARDVIGDAERAEDVVQDTLIAASRHGAPTQDEASLRAWLRRVVTNFARTTQRTEARRRAREADVARTEREPSTQEVVERIALQRVVATAVQELPSPDREIIALRYYDDLPPREIAARLGLTPNAVSTRLSRAKATLRERLRASDPSDYGAGRRSSWAAIATAWTDSVPKGGTVVAETGATGSLVTPVALVTMKKLALAVAVAVALCLAIVRTDPFGSPESAVRSVDRDEARVDEEAVLERSAPLSEPVARSAGDVPAAEEPAMVAETPAPAAARGTVHVTVHRRSDGAPVPGIGLSLYVLDSDRTWFDGQQGVTNTDGAVDFDGVPAGGAIVYIERPSEANTFGAERIVVAAGDTTDVRFDIVDGESVVGRVVDQAGRPVPGASIWLGDGSSAPFEGQVVTETDASGEFRIDHVSLHQGIAARASGHAPSVAWMPLLLEEGDGERRIELTLPGVGGAIDGKVVDRNGDPVADAVVVVGNSQLGRITKIDDVPTYDPPREVLRSDEHGRFHVDTQGAGDIRVRARGAETGIAERVVTVPAGGRAEVTLELSPAASIRGTVESASGAPIEGAEVEVGGGLDRLLRAHAKTDALGRFTLASLPAGDVTITVEPPGPGASIERRLTLIAGETREWRATLPTTSDLRGRVVTASGRALSGWRINAEEIERPSSGASAESNAQGEFTMPGRPDVAHRLEVRPPGQLFAEVVATIEELAPADGVATLVVADDDVPGCALRGRVLDAEGRPVQATIDIDAVRPTFVRLRVTCDEAGYFVVESLPPVQLDVEIAAEGFGTANRSLTSALGEDEQRELGDVVLERAE